MNRYNLSNVINRTHKSNWMNCAKRTIESTKPKCRCTIHHFKLTARELWVETKCICIYLRVIRSGARWTFVFLLLCSMGFWMMSIHMDWYPCDDGDGFWSAESANDKWERRKTIAWKKKTLLWAINSVWAEPTTQKRNNNNFVMRGEFVLMR